MKASISGVRSRGDGDSARGHSADGSLRYLRGRTRTPFWRGWVHQIVGDVVTGGAIAAADHPYVYGDVPCYTVEGVPYYTPPGEPC